MTHSKIEDLAVNTLRTLSVDMIQKANSGHPGKPLGSAPMAYTLWANHMNFNPEDPKWMNRDRFVLSAGHASALLYSLLHVFGYDLTIEDLKAFRQLNSRTPGHPEYGYTEGVEATTGPLGAGLSTAVGLAMAQEHMAARYNKENYPMFDNYTYVLSGDGCMMEGITSEASSLAGTLGLGRLIVLYDSNNITIEGHTDLAFQEDVRKRYEAYGFETFLVEDGNDLEAINAAIEKAKSNLDQPSFIEIRTKIGYGSDVEGSEAAHGSPLGEESIQKLKEKLNYPSLEPFHVEEEVYDFYASLVEEKKKRYDEWKAMEKAYREEYPDLAEAFDAQFKTPRLEELVENKELWTFDDQADATRNLSGTMINRLKDLYPNMIGGSADLASSNKTWMDGEESFSSENYGGRNLHFGVREHAMAAIGNGIALYGGLKPYVATFFVFSDFLKPMLRLSSIMGVPLTYVLTHDSIGVGEDGPTHEPIEQLAMLRSTPNVYTFRPADGKETAMGWFLALSSEKTPVALVLTRQNLPQLENTGPGALKGAYVVHEPGNDLDAILIATGSEVSLAIDAAKELEKEGIFARVVSMPSMELFLEQDASYQEEILPADIRSRVAVEAGSALSWGHFVGLDGTTVTIDRFGESAPGDVLFEEFGFTIERVKEAVKEVL